MILEYFPKFVSEVLDYQVDMSRWLADGETVATAQASATGSLEVKAVTYAPRLVTVRLAKGDGGNKRHTVTVIARTSTGQVKTVQLGIQSLSDGAAVRQVPTLTVTGGLVFGEPTGGTDPTDPTLGSLSVADIVVIAKLGEPPVSTNPGLSVADITVVAKVGAPAVGLQVQGVPTVRRTFTLGAFAALPDTITIADPNADDLALTLTATNGTMQGVTGLNAGATVASITGKAAALNAQLALLKFKPAAAGDAKIALSVVGASGTPITADYLVTGVAAATFSVLHTSAANIVDSSNKTVMLKTVNWFGGESTNYLPHGIWQRSYKSIIDQIAGMGFNCVRLAFSGDTFRAGKVVNGIDTSQADNADFILSGDPTKPNEVVFKSAYECWDIIINYLAVKGIYVVLDHHRRQAGAGADGSPIGTGYTEADWRSTWATVAGHFKAFSNVIGADIHNEPHDHTWSDWATKAEGCAAAIHAVTPDWLIFVEGVGTNPDSSAYWWGGALKGVSTRPVVLGVANKLVYSPHEYGQSVGSQTWLAYDGQTPPANWPNNLPAVFRSNWGFIAEQGIAPLWIGEYGGKFGLDGTGTAVPNGTYESQWVSQLVTYVKANGINHAYWSFNPNSGDTGGLVRDDWITPQTHKLNLISPLLA